MTFTYMDTADVLLCLTCDRSRIGLNI